MNTKIYSKFHSRHIPKELQNIATEIGDNYVKFDQNLEDKYVKKYFLNEKGFDMQNKLKFEYKIKLSNFKWNFLINHYLIENKYGVLENIDNECHLVFKVSNSIDKHEIDQYVRNCTCHIKEIVIEILNFNETIEKEDIKEDCLYKLIKEINPNHFLIEKIIKSKLFKKINLNLNIFIKKAKIKTEIKDEEIENFFHIKKLSDILLAKKNNIVISGATDILDVKKYVKKLIDLIKENKKIKEIINFIQILEKAKNQTFENSIIEDRINKEIKHLTNIFPDKKINLVEKIIMVSLLNENSTENIKFFSRLKNLKNKTVFLGQLDKIPICLEKIDALIKDQLLTREDIKKQCIEEFEYLINNHILKDFSSSIGFKISRIIEDFLYFCLINKSK